MTHRQTEAPSLTQDRQTDRQIDRQTDRQAGRQADRQIDRQRDREISHDKIMKDKANKQTDRPTDMNTQTLHRHTQKIHADMPKTVAQSHVWGGYDE